MYAWEDKIKITEAFLESGLTASAASRRPGWPGKDLLAKWVAEAQRGELPVQVCVPKGYAGKRLKHSHYTEKTKKEAVRLYEMGRRPVEIARLLGIERCDNVRSWWKKAMTTPKLPDKNTFIPKPLTCGKEMVFVAAKKDVPPEVAALSAAELENACLRAVLADLKVGSLDLDLISNKKKVELGERLRQVSGRALREITAFLKISKSSYEYNRKKLSRPDPYLALKGQVVELFWASEARYGYRRIWGLLKAKHICVSEKVIRRIMREGGLRVRYEPKIKHFNSYKGEISKAPVNLVKRDFHACAPNLLWLTDITEFNLNSFKCYLSPIIDCFDGKVVSWKLSQRADAALVNDMLDAALATLTPASHPVIHSDRGAHYRWPGWIKRCNAAGLIRSMSAKASCPDNAACEGFFGRLKNEFFYHRLWDGVSYDEFASALGSFLDWYNEKRIKKSLDWMSPVAYRKSHGLVA